MQENTLIIRNGALFKIGLVYLNKKKVLQKAIIV